MGNITYRQKLSLRASLRGLLFLTLAVFLLLPCTLHHEEARAGDGTCGVGAKEAAWKWYFAEGYTGPGFTEFLCLMNPGEGTASVQVNLLFPSGAPGLFEVEIPSHCRVTININGVVGYGTDVAMVVTSLNLPIIAERPMYFTYWGKWKGCTNVLGAREPHREWIFAEGTTRPGFEEWLCLMNPGEDEAEARIYFHRQDGGQVIKDLRIPSMQRRTVFVNQEMGSGFDVSAHILSNQPLVAERALYFNYRGKWQGGHATLGENAGERARYFAEGYTGYGFETYLTLYAPTIEGISYPNPLPVTLTFFLEDGSTRQVGISLPRNVRGTLLVNNLVGEGKSVSVKVETVSDVLVVERPMYFNYKGYCRGGHVTSGAAEPLTTWSFAEGNTLPGFEEWLCLMNPGGEATDVTIDYITGAGEIISRDYRVNPTSRFSIYLNNELPRGLDVSCIVHSSQPIVAERPLYYPSPHFEVLNTLDHLRYLAVNIGPRVEGTAGEKAAADYLASVLGSYGYQVSFQNVPLPNGNYTRNVVGRLAATRDSGRLVVLGAHYDTKMNTGSPGANDNGSGTVLVLEMARCLAESPPDMEVMVVFFGGEERLVEGSDLHHFGSRYFVHNLGNDDRSRFRGAIIVDMVGVGSQLYARTMGIGPMNLCNGLIGYAASIGPPLPYRQSGSYSDHEPFERAGLPAVWMEVMDDPYYHSPRDTIDKINPAHLERTGSLLLGFLHSQFFPR